LRSGPCSLSARLESSTSKELLHRAHDLFLAVDKAIMRGTQQFRSSIEVY
jgi:hypothetical protein